MAQGKGVKKGNGLGKELMKRATGNSSTKRKGATYIAPKKSDLVHHQKLQKQLSAKINKGIEESMAVKANALGKLTILKKTAKNAERRDRQQNAKALAKKR